VEEKSIDLRDILRTLQRRRSFILRTFFTFVILAVAISLLLPPTYEAETNLRIKQPKGLANSLLADLPMGSPAGTKQLMSTYAEILKSPTVVDEVIAQTQSDKEELPKYEDMIKRITTQPVKDTEILKVKVQAGTAEEAQLVANTLVKEFTERLTDLVRGEQKTVRVFIGQRLDEAKQELEQAETRLQAYKKQQQIIAQDAEVQALVDRLTMTKKLMADNAVTTAAAQAKVASARNQLAGQKPGFIADSPIMTQYKTKLADQEVQLVGLTKNLSDVHPQVRALRAAIGETRSKLEEEANRIVTANAPSSNPVHVAVLQAGIQAEAELSAAQAQRGALNGVMAEQEQELSKLPAKEQGLVRAMRDATVAQEIYVMLAKRHEEARISEVMEPTDVQIIDVAKLPERPIKPKKALNVVIAAILGLFVGVGGALVLEQINRTVRTAEDVQEFLDIPVLGSIPDFDSRTTLQTSCWQQLKEKWSAVRGTKGGNGHG